MDLPNLPLGCGYFTPKHRVALYRTQVRPHMEYCSHLWAGVLQYQLDSFERIHRRAVRIVGDPMICAGLDTLALRRDVSCYRCAFSTAFICGECSGELFDLLPAAEFSNLIKTPLLCGFVGISFRAPLNCGMAHLRQCFQVDTNWVPSKNASISTLKAGNASVAPLVLHRAVGDGDQLPPSDPNARLPCLFP